MINVHSGFRIFVSVLAIIQVIMPVLEDLKDSWKIAKSKVTRFGNQVSTIIAEGDSTAPLMELVVKLKQAFG